MSDTEMEPRRLSVDQLIDAWEEAWSARDPAAFVAICTANVSYEDPLVIAPLTGPAALGGHAQRLWTAFPDARLERSGARLSAERFIAAPARLLATNTGPLEALPATQKFLAVPMVFYCQTERGRLLRVRAFFDLYDAATQLGVLPSRGTLSERALLMLRGFGLRAGR
ncbi:ester cyclase [Conexibacter sp. DBS9H8]|uniref:ester cyclase n=1 Tax=Conexibacter sp. DBS9H8 TaxID=2937801 RepID=UPI00200F7422|nr:ester cyclase [Conexibacter sp. DBS9H8]